MFVVWISLISATNKIISKSLLTPSPVTDETGTIYVFGSQTAQKVNKGDLLVSQITIDSQMNEKTSEVIGSVYAYTFYKVDIEIENKYPIGLGYYICLLRSRMQFDLDVDERIIKEISLHFSEDLDTIRMSNYYVLYEKISIVGE